MANEQNLRPFKQGNDDRRNVRGRPRKLPEIEKLLDEVLGEEKDGITAMEAIVKALRSKAAKGDIRAAELLMDRAYGKAKQELKHTISEDQIFQIAGQTIKF